MVESSRSIFARSGLPLALAFAVFAAGCTTAPEPKTAVRESAGKEYFAESEYGVKASPRVTSKRTRLPRGGGREMVGKPYKVKGRWYKPQEDKDYVKVGAASWYGDAFHGRLTANGEVYDMTHLTAAHPTMPLPSYARVTNTANGASVVVRVNDRGPFAHNRIIDLSKRAAELLDYKHVGVAKVKVEYVGRAPLHGRDDNYLLASYRPGKTGIDRPRLIDDGLPTGVMVAMNGTTPTTKKRSWFGSFGEPGQPQRRAAQPPVAAPLAVSGASAVAAVQAEPLAFPDAPAQGEVLASDPVLPEFGPSIPDRPYDGFGAPPAVVASAALSYADQRIGNAARALDLTVAPGFDAADVAASWKRRRGETAVSTQAGEYVAAGAFVSRGEAELVASGLKRLGHVSVVADEDAFVVELRSDGRHAPDELARLARGSGAPEAFLVRD